jgi:thioredoxin 1
MSRTAATNTVVILAVVAIVAGAGWFKSRRANTPKEEAPQAAASAPAVTLEQSQPENPTPPVSPEPAHSEAIATPGAIAESTEAVCEPTAPEEPKPDEPAAAEKLPRLVDLGADKCIPCKKLAPILQELRKEYQGKLSVELIDVWKNPAAGQPYNIRVIPTQILYDRDGKEVWRHEGFISKEDLKALFAEKVGVK